MSGGHRMCDRSAHRISLPKCGPFGGSDRSHAWVLPLDRHGRTPSGKTSSGSMAYPRFEGGAIHRHCQRHLLRRPRKSRAPEPVRSLGTTPSLLCLFAATSQAGQGANGVRRLRWGSRRRAGQNHTRGVESGWRGCREALTWTLLLHGLRDTLPDLQQLVLRRVGRGNSRSRHAALVQPLSARQ